MNKLSFRESRYQKNSFNPDQSSQSVVLTISNHSTVFENYLNVNKLIPVFTALKVTHLIIECQQIFVRGLIRILHLSPNLNSLKIQALSLLKPICLSNEETETLDLISKNNKIIKVNLGQINELAEVQFLINLCPNLQYFEVNCPIKIDLKSLAKFILMQTTQSIAQLRTLCINGNKPNDEIIKELQDMINRGQWFQNYTITCTEEKICIQLE